MQSVQDMGYASVLQYDIMWSVSNDGGEHLSSRRIIAEVLGTSVDASASHSRT